MEFRCLAFSSIALVLLLLLNAPAHGQQSDSPTDPSEFARSNPQVSTKNDDDDDVGSPARPGDANPAEFQRPGVLQIEYGFDAGFRSKEARSEQAGSLTLRYSPFERVLVELDVDTVVSQVDRMGVRETSVGDTSLGVQFLGLRDTKSHPAVAFAYFAKLPTASRTKGLGSGRTDHRIVILVSKNVRKYDVDINIAYLNAGREGSTKRDSGIGMALAISRELGKRFGVIGELSGQTLDDSQAKGIFALSAITYKVNRRLQLDTGMRFGLDPNSSRVGLFAGFSVAVGNPFKK